VPRLVVGLMRTVQSTSTSGRGCGMPSATNTVSHQRGQLPSHKSDIRPSRHRINPCAQSLGVVAHSQHTSACVREFPFCTKRTTMKIFPFGCMVAGLLLALGAAHAQQEWTTGVATFTGEV
jgi:hypothetical protein